MGGGGGADGIKSDNPRKRKDIHRAGGVIRH